MTLVSAIVVTQRGGPLLEACLAGAARGALRRWTRSYWSSTTALKGWPTSGAARPARRAATSASPAGSWRGLEARRGRVDPARQRRRRARAGRRGRRSSARPARRAPGRRAARCASTRGATRSTPRGWWSTGSASASTAWRARRPSKAAPVEEVFGASACVALYRRAMLDAIGGFDASFFAFGEDADVAWRARIAGWSCALRARERRLPPRLRHRRRGVAAEVLPRRPQPDAAAGQERDGPASSRAGAGRWRSTTSPTWRSSPPPTAPWPPARPPHRPARVADVPPRGRARPEARLRSPRRPARSARGGRGRRTGRAAR